MLRGPGAKDFTEAFHKSMPFLIAIEEGGGPDSFQESFWGVLYLHVPFCPPLLAPEPGPGLPGLPAPRPSLGPLAPIGGPVPSCLGIGTSFLLLDMLHRPIAEPPEDAAAG